jgi:hypothetical protein
MKLAIVTLVTLAACDPQVDGTYAGDPMVRVRGLVTGFAPGDVVDGGEIRWNTQVGAELRTGPVTPVPVASLAPAGVELEVIDTPDDVVGFGFGDGATISEGHLLLVDGTAVMGEAVNDALIYVDRDVDDGSLAAADLGAAMHRGYLLCVVLPSIGLAPAQAVLARACGGTPDCASQRRYQLVPAVGDLGANVQFFRAGGP